LDKNSPTVSESTIEKEKEVDPKDLIYSPQIGRITATLERILYYTSERHRQIQSFHGFDSHPYYYLSLDYLNDVLQKDPILSADLKDKTNVTDALRQMVDEYNSGKHKYGYLYPVLMIEEGKLITKIVIIAPQVESTIFLKPFRTNCFNYSLKVVDMILTNKIQSAKKTQTTENLDSLLIKEEKGSKKVFKPDAIALESDLKSIIKKGFKDFEYIDMSDFFEDVMNYGKSKNLIIQIGPNYHIGVDKININAEGGFEKRPELYFHFLAQTNALQKIVVKEILDISNDLGQTNIRNAIVEYLRTYKPNISEDVMEEVKRARDLIEIAESIKDEKGLPGNDSRLLKASKESASYLRRIIELLPSIEVLKSKMMVQNQIDSFLKKIKNHSKSNKTLLVTNIEKIRNESKLKDKNQLSEFESQIKKIIKKDLGFYEVNSPQGISTYYIVDPACISPVLLNLAKLSQSDPANYKKQYDIIKLIYGNLKNQAKLILDSDLSESEKETVESELASFFQDQKKSKDDAISKKNSFNWKMAFSSAGLVFIVLLVLFLITKSIFFGLAIVPLSIFVGLISGKLFRNKLSDEKQDESLLNETEKEIFSGKNNALSNLLESVVYPKEIRTIEDRIYDSKKLKDFLKLNLDLIKSTSENLKNVDNESAILVLEDLVLKFSTSISLVKNMKVKNKPNTLIFSKRDLKNLKFKKELIEYFQSKANLAKAESFELFEYYMFFVKVLNKEK
jgi:hypothetical protein